MKERLTVAACLPVDRAQAMLVGRAWVPVVDGAVLVGVRGDDLVDLSSVAPTASALTNLPDPAAAILSAGALPRIAPLAAVLANSAEDARDPALPWLLAPCDLQAIKAAGVTFVASMLERVIEEQARGDPAKAESVRTAIVAVIGDNLSSVRPGSPEAARLKDALIAQHAWSQYLEVGIGPDAEIFTKSQPMSAVGTGAAIGIHPQSAWNNPEPEIVLAIGAHGRTVGATLGNDVNLRDFEGRSALLLGKAKDNNASCAIGPFIRLFDAHFGIDDVRRCDLAMRVDGPDGFTLDGSSAISMISRDPLDLAGQAIGPNHQYPDGFVLFLGTMFAPTKDRHGPGQGFTHVIGEYAQADAAQAQAAIAAAKQAFPAWSTGGIQDRANVLDKAGAEILARKDELGTLLSREEGKTLAEGIGEAVRAGQIFRFFAGEVVRQAGEKLASVRPGVDVEVTREPLGVVGLITPWNFPIAIPAWKIAPALACGNTVVCKPADLVPGCAWAIAEILSRAGLPPGVFNLAMGRGSVVGEALVGSHDVTALSFTGSVSTGRSIAAKAIARMAKLQLEMGGKNPLVVLDDADLPTAVSVAVQGAYFSTGQRCTASSRIIVTKGIHDRFVAAVADRLSTLRTDNALLPGTDIGPVVDQSQLDVDLKYLEVGKAEGARLVVGGERLQRATEGYYFAPALFTDTTGTMRIAREEIFGPVACVIRAQDYDEALSMANDTEFGLSAGIVTTSLKYASHFKRHAQAGMVMVNVPTAGADYHVPFGGRKGSSYGSREQGRYAAEFFTTVKTAYTAP